MTMVEERVAVKVVRPPLTGSWGRGDWKEHGLCNQVGGDMFYPPDREDRLGENGTSTLYAKQVCAKCPVRELCLEWALHSPRREFGVWGGTTESERREMRRLRNISEVDDGDEEEDWVVAARARMQEVQGEV